MLLCFGILKFDWAKVDRSFMKTLLTSFLFIDVGEYNVVSKWLASYLHCFNTSSVMHCYLSFDILKIAWV